MPVISNVRHAVSAIVHILGTNHGYQFGSGARLNRMSTCSKSDELQFSEEIRRLCRARGLFAIAEEMSAEALTQRDRKNSVPESVARELSLPHKYCDPDREMQARLGIADEGGIIAMGCMRGQSRRDIRALVYAERRKREPLWKSELEILGLWPVLFICGSWHVPSFSSLLETAGHPTSVVHRNWHA